MPPANQAPYCHEGVWVRGPHEEYTIKEQKLWKHVPVKLGDVVLDAGGHIGCAALYFLSRGAALIHSYEPEPSNYELLCKNVAVYGNVRTYHAALVAVGEKRKTLPLYLSTGKFTTTHTLFAKRGRPAIEVPTVPFLAAVQKHLPNVLKLDIEGTELTFLQDFTQLPLCVRAIGMEVHYNNKGARDKAKELRQILAKRFREIRPMKYLEGGWTTCIAVWERR